MKESLIKLFYKIDRLTLRERIIISVTAILVLLVLWLLLIYSPQKKSLTKMNLETQQENTDTLVLTQKRKTIENLATDNTVPKLMAKFDSLKLEMQQLEEKASRYNQRFISEDELAKLLYSILKQTDGVSIQSFSNTAFSTNHATETVAAPVGVVSSMPTDAATSAPSTSNGATQDLPLPEIPSERMQYKLTLNGDYFSVMAYLSRLEKLDWQLYWDKFDYKVTSYPQATVLVEFYTLRPATESPVTAKGAKP